MNPTIFESVEKEIQEQGRDHFNQIRNDTFHLWDYFGNNESSNDAFQLRLRKQK